MFDYFRSARCVFVLLFPLCAHITQRLLSLSMLSKSMDFVAINSKLMKVLDGCAVNIKALDSLLIHFQTAVGVQCFSHLLNNCGNELASREIDRFSGHLHVILAHSHYAKGLWRRETKVAPPRPVSHRWSSRQLRNKTLVQVWPGTKTFVDKSTSTEESKSKAVQAPR